MMWITQGVNANLLREKLSSRVMTGIGKRSSEYTVPLNVEQARNSRDALGKTLYSRMFDWIVQAVNAALAALSARDSNPLCLGVLDIFGFEVRFLLTRYLKRMGLSSFA